MTSSKRENEIASGGLRALSRDDFEQVVALDKRITGHARRGYFEKRLQAALRHPDRHLQVAVGEPGELVAFGMARIVEGEYGRPEPAGLLETINVDPGKRGAGFGQTLIEGLATACIGRGAHELMTQARWTDVPMLQFFERAGFHLAPRQILDCSIQQVEVFERQEIERQTMDADPGASLPTPAQVVIRTLKADDSDALVRVDRKITGDERTAYLARHIEDALEESAIRVSMVAEQDEQIIGFVMARVDSGDFGQTEPVAALDTIAIDPAFGGGGVGQALVGQLLGNLRALRVERIETQVERENFRLLGFLYRCGFEPSQHLAFSKVLD